MSDSQGQARRITRLAILKKPEQTAVILSASKESPAFLASRIYKFTKRPNNAVILREATPPEESTAWRERKFVKIRKS